MDILDRKRRTADTDCPTGDTVASLLPERCHVPHNRVCAFDGSSEKHRLFIDGAESAFSVRGIHWDDYRGVRKDDE